MVFVAPHNRIPPDTLALTRKEAAYIGYLRFWPGVPCGRGHRAMRHVSTGICTQCLAEDYAERKAARK